ncbi:MAG TPA: sigma-70 family RNA polymerase sigma factor, partial [Chloroflexota bacterium]|nr:sigma-70 family RNA polymerase sigma factor [Chloroflexota bacterium]
MSVPRAADLRELVGAAQRGDDAAFAGIVVRFQRLAVGLAVGWLGDVELAREAAQEAFLDAHLHLDDLRDPAAFAAWFRRIVAKHCDRLTRRPSLPMAASLSDAEAVADDAPDPGTAVERRDEARAVRAALERLPARERVIVALQYLGSYSQVEIARILSLPLTTVKKRAHDARGRLREELVMVRTTLSVEGTGGLEPFADQVELFLAVRRGDAAAVASLLARRPELVGQHESWPETHAHRARLPYARHATALIRAAERGDLAIVKLLVEAGAAVDDACGCSTGETPLWAAAVTDYPDVVAYLLDRGADPNARGALAHTALHVAAMRGWPRLAQMLLTHGASPDLKDDAGRTALDWAELKGHAEVATLLRAASAGGRIRGISPRQDRLQPKGSIGDLCETGIKMIDLFAPLRHGDLVLV